jgi:CRISPR/Cas system-associated exonuclease Cas4 (RecB family)
VSEKKRYSFSKISCYKQCPKKYYWNYINKAPKDPGSLAPLIKGRAVHAIIEDYPEKTTHKGADVFQPLADKFINSELGQKYLQLSGTNELSFGLTRDLKPCEYYDKEALFIGKIDYICVILSTLHLIDWKTGKKPQPRWVKHDQLLYYAIYFFQRYANIDKIKISLVYVEHDAESEIVLERKYLYSYIHNLLSGITDIEADTLFLKKPSALCPWCEFRTHCSKN